MPGVILLKDVKNPDNSALLHAAQRPGKPATRRAFPCEVNELEGTRGVKKILTGESSGAADR